MHTLTKNTITAGIIMLGLALAIGCNETPTQTPDSLYELNGLVVIDPNLEGTMVSRSLRTAAHVHRNDELWATAGLTLGSYQLSFAARQFNLDSIYHFWADDGYAITNSTVPLRLVDADLFADTFQISVPDSFSIINIIPSNRLLQGLDPVSVEWTGSAGAEAYIVGAVKNDSAYAVDGFSAYADEQATSFTIPAEAFMLDNGLDPDTGLYLIYVYAIAGSPDSAMASAFLPTHIPGSYADNIASESTVGSFGSIVVTKFDTIRVVVQP